MKPCEWLIFFALCSLPPTAYEVGRRDGVMQGREMEHGVKAMQKSEHDRLMQYVGVCKWAKIMAEDIRCKQELP